MLRKRPVVGFTIVELLIVIVVIGILAAIIIVAFNGVSQKARVATMISDLTNGAKQLKIDQTINSDYPATVAAANGGKGLSSSPGVTYRYSVDNSANPRTFCLTATDGTNLYSVTESKAASEGSCVNVALGATVTTSASTLNSSPGTQPLSIVTDGVTATSPWIGTSVTGLNYMMVDLGSPTLISSIKVWHYWSDARTYNNTKTEVSTDNSNWTTIYDSAVSGTYQETPAGKTFTFTPRNVRYIRDWVNGSSSNTGNHWVEIQAY